MRHARRLARHVLERAPRRGERKHAPERDPDDHDDRVDQLGRGQVGQVRRERVLDGGRRKQLR